MVQECLSPVNIQRIGEEDDLDVSVESDFKDQPSSLAQTPVSSQRVLNKKIGHLSSQRRLKDKLFDLSEKINCKTLDLIRHLSKHIESNSYDCFTATMDQLLKHNGKVQK